MSDMKQVKVDNWGIYFLQRLKHFFNRTDYCDLTLQFQDNAQLKVHRLVLNACTEYFEILERTCEMYEDCLVMPEDLQADVVVPIINFMYTGQLEFRMDSLEKLYQTSQVMNMPVLSKLLEAHRGSHSRNTSQNYNSMRKYAKGNDSLRQSRCTSTPSGSSKRSYSKAFESIKSVTSNKLAIQPKSTPKSSSKKEEPIIVFRDKKLYMPINEKPKELREPSPIPLDKALYTKKLVLGEPRPTRYELPEELDTDNIFDNSFSNISYTSKPLMVHPETTKQYSSKRSGIMNNDASSSRKAFTTTTVDIVECKKVSHSDSLFDDDTSQNAPDDIYDSNFLSINDGSPKDPSQLFDQILDNNDTPKVTIEAKDKQASNLDHAKIISEVLKKYPHLVKSNKNIKLKILNTQTKVKKNRTPAAHIEDRDFKPTLPSVKTEASFETDVLNSQEAAKLISMGAENTKGPWICLICGTPGKALNFTTYYSFRRHLVEVHKEKPVSTLCEYCGLRSSKRNYLLYHIYLKHGIPPPPHYNFPKCNQCNYIAPTEGFLVRHKLNHEEPRPLRCPVCTVVFSSNNQLLLHMQKTGHKQQLSTLDKKPNIQCVYCMKVFLRGVYFYAHLKTVHKEQAIKDGILEESDDESQIEDGPNNRSSIKYEQHNFENELEDIEMPYQNQKRADVNKKSHVALSNSNQKILNTGYNAQMKQTHKAKLISDANNEFNRKGDESSTAIEENIVIINDTEYIMKDNQLIPRKSILKQSEEYIISDFINTQSDSRLHNLENVVPTASMEFNNIHTEVIEQPKMILKKSNLNQPIQIVVSNEEEYKALMASNHSIIFDDGESNKTLTVLTAPDNSSMETTTIDLNTAQSNDMMIIQEDFPLNVSEAVSGENSKYVVVYSHAMEHDDPNKQYQIITSEEIGDQYVQTSADMTQNYETINTTTTVVSANVIEAQMNQTWAPNDQQTPTSLLVGSETELQAIAEQDQIDTTNSIKQIDNEHHLMELPEVQIMPQPSKSTLVDFQQSEEEVMNQSNDGNLEPISNSVADQMIIEEHQPDIVNDCLSVNNQPEEPVDNEVSVLQDSEITIENSTEQQCQKPENDDNTNQVELTEMSVPVQDLPDNNLLQAEQPEMALAVEYSKKVIEENTQLDESANNQIVEVSGINVIKEIPTTHDTTTIETNVADNIENVTIEEVPISENNGKPVVEAKDQIKNLTSEWSEDEYDTLLEECEPNKGLPQPESENVVSESPKLEESIENIQQELQKQMVYAEDSNKTVEDDLSSQKEEIISSQVNSAVEKGQVETVPVVTEATQEKISSLLNDWEDNDSQEENSTINDNGDVNTAASERVVNPEKDEITDIVQDNVMETTKDESKKDDNIKSLVSDWDDDEEEKE